MFGRSYSELGTSSSDLLLKTRGQVKIQWGNKFIDLIKDGKVNVDSKFIFKTDKIGTKDGIYIIEDKVYLVTGGQSINLIGDVGNTYVSFIGEQKTSSEQKRQALINIGFLYPNLQAVNESAVSNGIVYIESENKLYFIKNKQLEEFKITLPSPITQQLVFSTNDEGAIVINGEGKNNSIVFTNTSIYNKNIKCNSDFTIDASTISLFGDINVNDSLTVDTIQSSNDNFKLYVDSYTGQSILEVYKVIETGKTDTLQGVLVTETVVSNTYNVVEEGEDYVLITFDSDNSYLEGDVLFYVDEDSEEYKTLTIKSGDSTEGYITNQSENSLLESGTILYRANNPSPIIFNNGSIGLFKYENEALSNVVNIGTYQEKEGLCADFNYAQYNSVPDTMPENANKNAFAPIKWLEPPLPSNSIIMYQGSVAPEGWAICDGTNGTPTIPSTIVGVNYIIKL